MWGNMMSLMWEERPVKQKNTAKEVRTEVIGLMSPGLTKQTKCFDFTWDFEYLWNIPQARSGIKSWWDLLLILLVQQSNWFFNKFSSTSFVLLWKQPDLISGIIALQPLFVCCIPNCLNYYKMGLESNKDIYLFILRNCICNDDTNLTNNG